MIVIGALSYVGSMGEGYLKYPWDYIAAIALSIIFFVMSVMQGFETKEIAELRLKVCPLSRITA
ncbi:MAG: hypothetical protein AT712_02520 [Caldivirga sp. CIS_19]|jgi:hypothetical protein|nr:MAG: hypothetical protein AT712_02520 [Caldivirga sp. CIS_19]